MTDQKAAIITGGSSGIGRAAAVELAKQGIKIAIVVYRDGRNN
jgi:NAD(P)-dependent dehydrogenase (short-subunit alcohol dehydrogenase family)